MSSNSQDDQAFLEETLPIFIEECNEQLETMEQILLELEEDSSSTDLLNTLFRCVHTIKGSAGFFGLEAMVGFTHHVETLLDKLREGLIPLTPELSTLLLTCEDTIRHLLRAVSQPESDTEAHLQRRLDIIVELQKLTGLQDAPKTATPSSPNQQTSTILASQTATQALKRWTIVAAFGIETFRNGMDPLSIMGYLGKLGLVIRTETNIQKIPRLIEIDPESCYLSITLELETEKPQLAIEEAFSFVLEDCDLTITQHESMPQSALSSATNAGLQHVPISNTVTTTQVTEVIAVSTGQIPPSNPTQGTGTAQAPVNTARVASAASEENRFIRVAADRLDRVINLLGELVVASAGAEMMARQSKSVTMLEANLHIARLIEEIRSDALLMRMVPIGETFSRFRRVVRDNAASLGKEIQFDFFGGETELDKSMVEKIVDPLMHIVRNSIDHGLETPEERVLTGKDPKGLLTLSAQHETGSILITIKDDGRGIRRDKVLQRAWERGLVEKGVTPSDADIVKLIFAPGFSTAEQVTNLSGRGVGMDVVRSNINALRGQVQIESIEGSGTEIKIRLPLTLAIIDGFLVDIAGAKFIFPLVSVVEVIEGKSFAISEHHGATLVELRKSVLPVLNLKQVYGMDTTASNRTSIVVVRSGENQYGVAVDSLMGQHQTVIKPMGRIFKSLQFVSGSTILGNGEVALIFDVHALNNLAVSITQSDQAQLVK
jgi:two-component system chemotaxis sensor kinase CheA